MEKIQTILLNFTLDQCYQILICYYALTFLRLLELKEFDSEIPTQKIVEFIRNFNVTENYDGTFINTATYR